MKKFIYILLIQLISVGIYAQAYTPFGTSIDGFILPEASSPDLALWESQGANWVKAHGNGQVIKTSNATQTYNCHSFAWNMSEGGNTMWINLYNYQNEVSYSPTNPSITPPGPSNISNYWTDGSYIEVSESQATKVWFGSCWIWNGTLGRWQNNCDHSAIRLSTDLYESKWGAWPRYRHPVDKCPYNINNRRYFKFSLTISGSSQICDEATYTIENFDELPPGATVQWSANNDNLILVSAQSNTATFKKNGNGESIIQNDIIIGTTNLTLQHFVWSGVPPIPIDIVGPGNFDRLAPNTQYHFTVVTNNSSPDDYIEWNVKRGNIVYGQGSKSVSVVTDNITGIGSFSISAKVRNSCGWGLSYKKAGLIDGGLGPFSLYPNPTTDIVTVELEEEQPVEAGFSTQRTAMASSTGSYEIQLWSASAMLRQYTTDQPVYQMSLNGLPAGIYFVRVIKDGQTNTKKLIKK